MSTHIETEQRITDARNDQGPRLVPDAADPIAQRMQDAMAQLVRQGLDTSLKSVQVWADLARQCDDSTALAAPFGATMASRAHDPFVMLLAAQREIVGELVAAQRQLTQQAFDANAGGPCAFR